MLDDKNQILYLGSTPIGATQSRHLVETNLVSPHFFCGKAINELKEEIQLEIALDSRQPT
jgi:hypothetical protein